LIEPTSSDGSNQQPKKRVGLSTTVGPDRLEGIHGRKSDRRSLVGAVGLRIVCGHHPGEYPLPDHDHRPRDGGYRHGPGRFGL